MGVELYSNPDTMVFHRDYRCWGNFMESDISNELFLNITCPWNKYNPRPETQDDKHTLHVGSTMLLMDTNGDGLKDMLLGDTDYPNLIQLINGGTTDSAHFVSQELNFPSNTKSIELFSIPVPSFIDINNDGVNELIISVFDPSTLINETKESVWLYKNHGTNDSLDLEFIQENFLQDMMIELGSGAYPVVQDWNGDGLPDLFVSNFGNRDSSWYENGFLYSSYTSSLSLFENIGTASEPAFKLITEDFAGLSSLDLLAAYPAFTDLDGDGDIDMVIGNQDGTLLYFQNIAGPGNTMNMVLSDPQWLGIDVGNFSTPVFFDLTKNGLPDLVVGNRMGYLSYWENTGTASNPIFTHVTDTLGQVYTADLMHSYFGHSVPCFYRNSQGETFLFTGSSRGWLLHYKEIDNNLNGVFQIIDTLFVADGNDKLKILEGMRVAPWVADMDNDGYPELLVGNFRGGLAWFAGVQPPPDTVGIEPLTIDDVSFLVYPNPFTDNITIETKQMMQSMSVVIYSSDGKIVAGITTQNANMHTFNTSNFNPGLYILKVTGNVGKQSTSPAYFKMIRY
jgi:hypothetical protein